VLPITLTSLPVIRQKETSGEALAGLMDFLRDAEKFLFSSMTFPILPLIRSLSTAAWCYARCLAKNIMAQPWTRSRKMRWA
jgi:hypothetical protein